MKRVVKLQYLSFEPSIITDLKELDVKKSPSTEVQDKVTSNSRAITLLQVV
ncbi:MAG: hypothetical protein NZ929_03090 [Aigarchaeota archaeon]|nr:hypothetical protein [Aigarchaeota archaeon]MCX8192602.1 hypothetical protein [Nitrososphaeria archaeon]MDW7985662.1 hypothetical protein [Nitrososphaerota archaeon]